MCLESADHAFSNVASMHIHWDYLVLAFPFVGDVGDVRGAAFVVKYI